MSLRSIPQRVESKKLFQMLKMSSHTHCILVSSFFTDMSGTDLVRIINLLLLVKAGHYFMTFLTKNIEPRIKGNKLFRDWKKEREVSEARSLKPSIVLSCSLALLVLLKQRTKTLCIVSDSSRIAKLSKKIFIPRSTQLSYLLSMLSWMPSEIFRKSTLFRIV